VGHWQGAAPVDKE